MDTDADVRAYDALAEGPRVTDVVALARTLLHEMARTRLVSFPDDQRVRELAAELKLSHDEASTPFGNALEVLGRGPEDDAERALVRAIAAHALLPGVGTDELDRAAGDLIWLAAHTPFDATSLVDRAAGPRAAAMWDAIAGHLQRIDAGQSAELGRGEALVAAAALASSAGPTVGERVSKLAREVRDPRIARVLAGAHAMTARRAEDDRSPQSGAPEANKALSLRGEMNPAPRGPVATVALAVSGILLALYAVRLFGRVAFAYKKPAEVSLSEDGGVRVRWRTELLGRTLRDGDVVVPRVSLARATREVRYPRVVLYAGLLALSIGSYLGVAAFVDGVRAASPSLLATGLAVVALGLAIDFALSSIAPSTRGKCRLLFVSRDGRTLCVGGVETALADALLARLSSR
jgi:hypothetical protein